MKKLRLVNSHNKTKGKTNASVDIVTQQLSKLLANTYCLYLKTQNYHWNVTGPTFIMLHGLFESQYEELADASDLIAERIRALHAHAPGSFAEFSKLMSLSEAKKGASSKVMLESLTADHETVIEMLITFLGTEGVKKDEATQDLLIERLRAHEKTHWMLKSHLE